MKKIYYNKLVRDKIPQVIKAAGGKAKFKRLTSKKFEKELLAKVEEEAMGLQTAKNKKEMASEIADILEIIEAVKKLKKIPNKDIENALRANMERKGGFKKRLFLIWAEDTGYRTNERRGKK